MHILIEAEKQREIERAFELEKLKLETEREKIKLEATRRTEQTENMQQPASSDSNFRADVASKNDQHLQKML